MQPSTSPIALCFGASGAIGRFLLPRLRAGGWRVMAVSRQPGRVSDARLLWLCTDLAGATIATKGIGAVISVGPLDAFVEWLERSPLAPGVRVVAMSSMSAVSKSASADGAERALSARLLEYENRLMRRCDAAGLAWTILRPTLIYGAGIDRSLTPLVRFARRTRLFPWLWGATGLRQPVHADDLAAACAAALAAPQAAGQRLETGGGEVLPFATLLDRVRRSCGVATIPVPVPLAALQTAAVLSGRGRGIVQRLRQDLTADNQAAGQLLGFVPRPFLPDPGCWSPLPELAGPHPVEVDSATKTP
ncbi:SDR family oxidoreductase [Tahibacter amnicola]|uniref:NAD-dependent epimerase/dehydratase domain-containing protein n=1 Tax=Tahibacter amnicola TaxID=2976241 RepID=A0ABY6BJS0_9GAMM|nr:NAD-dependent epimerase/dehydratase family protein [Tahibacter amnicola]UXI68846.1 hypothetical protein N4264_04095 [Tahibacter amnicola]